MKNLVNILIVVVVVVFLVKACNRASEVHSWPETKGEIISHEVEKYKDSHKYTDSNGKKQTKWKYEYRIEFRYIFKVEDIEYTGIFKVDDLKSDKDIKRKLNLYPNGKSVRVKYDPNNPNDSERRI